MEREAAGDPERAARRPAVAGSERAGGIFDERDLLRHRGLEGLPLDRSPEQVNGHDGARLRGDRRCDRRDVDVERIRVDVDQNGLGAAQLDDVRRRGERVGGDDDLVPRPDLECQQC